MILEGAFNKRLAQCCHFSELFLEDWTQVPTNTTKFNEEFSAMPCSREQGTSAPPHSVTWERQLFWHTEFLSLHLVIHPFNKCLLRAHHAKTFYFHHFSANISEIFYIFPTFYTKNAEHNLIFLYDSASLWSQTINCWLSDAHFNWEALF